MPIKTIATALTVALLSFTNVAKASAPYMSEDPTGAEQCVLAPYTIETTGKNIYTIDLGMEITGDVDSYVALAKFIDSQPEGVTLKFKMHNFGGSATTGVLVVNALMQTKAYTQADVMGETYSMGALIAANCKEVTIEPAAFLMFHTASGTFMEPMKINNEIQSLQATEKQIRNMLDPIVKRKILTQQQEDDIMKGTDVYLFSADVKGK